MGAEVLLEIRIRLDWFDPHPWLITSLRCFYIHIYGFRVGDGKIILPAGWLFGRKVVGRNDLGNSGLAAIVCAQGKG
jgi:hypothetical protein